MIEKKKDGWMPVCYLMFAKTENMTKDLANVACEKTNVKLSEKTDEVGKQQSDILEFKKERDE